MLATALGTPKDALEEALLGLGCKASVLHAMAKLVHLPTSGWVCTVYAVYSTSC